MSRPRRSLRGAAIATLLSLAALPLHAASPDLTSWFRTNTQALFDALTNGERTIWDRAMDADCLVTTEDGEFLSKAAFLQEAVRPLPPGFSGSIKVRDLTVRPVGGAVLVHYWLDERENIFDQELRTAYVETDVYRRTKGSWKLLAMQVTVVPRDLQPVAVNSSGWPALVGEYRLSEHAASSYRVFLRDGALYGGSDPSKATRLIPLAPLVFFQQGSIHIMVFVPDRSGAVTEVLELHKYNEVRMQRVLDSKH
ncbi:MAG: nuclear transport factor 2 family protein [Steroidobacteraceae bacterium]